MKNPFLSLRARLVLFVFSAILLTSVAVMGLSLGSIDRFLREEINQQFPVLLASRADSLSDWYGQREREIEVFARSDVLVGNVPVLSKRGSDTRRRRARHEIEQYMRYVLDGFRQYTTLFVLDPQGELLLQVGAPLELAEPDRLRLAGASAIAIGGVRRLPTGSVQVVSAPLRANPLVTPVGTLHAAFEVALLRDELAADDVAMLGQMLIVDREGRLVASSSEDDSPLAYTGPLATEAEPVVVEEYEHDTGKRFVGAALAFERFGWTLVVEEPYDVAFAPVVGAMRNVLLIDLAILLAVGFAAFRIAVSIIRPIEALSVAARRISDGEKSVEIPEMVRDDEVGVLTRAFRAMTTRLTRNAAELEESHTALEDANGRLQVQNEALQSVNEVLEQLSITDGLTKLHNHRHFQETLLQECKRSDRSGRDLSLVLVDVDHFKRWNDRLGHAGGDEILRRIAEVLSTLVRDTDTLARYGGEEFGLIAPDTDLEGARALAEKIRTTVAETEFLLDAPSERQPVTVSVGVAQYEDDRVRLFNEADRALYLAKESGRDCVMTSEDLT